MSFYFTKLNNVPGFEDNVLNRNTIKRIKKMLVYQKEEYASLRERFLSVGTKNAPEEGPQESSGSQDFSEPSLV